MKGFLAGLLGLSLFAGPASAGCGAAPGPCLLARGEYELVLPPAGGVNLPSVMFLHGAGSSGKTTMGNKRLINSLVSRGYAVLAPTGGRRFRKGPGYVWNFYPGREGRDAARFLREVAADAAGRFGLNRERMLLAGFSAGAFMVNYLACDDPGAFAAYAPVSGGFWRPHPQRCAGPVRLLHTHGWSDKTVPLEGRVLGGGKYEQGDIFAGLGIWRAANRCVGQDPDSHSETGVFWRRKWSDCAPGSALELAMFSGGHRLPAGWGDMVLDWFEADTAPIAPRKRDGAEPRRQRASER